MKKVKVEQFVSYNGHSVKTNKTVSLSFKAMYSELVNTVKALQLLNNDVKIVAVVAKKEIPIGTFMVKNVSIGSDGESVIKFDSMTDAVELENITSLIGLEAEFKVIMSANVEEEDDEEEAENEDNTESDDDDGSDDEDWDDVEDEDWGEDDE